MLSTSLLREYMLSHMLLLCNTLHNIHAGIVYFITYSVFRDMFNL